MIELGGAKDAGEYARIDDLTIDPFETAAAPAGTIVLGLNEADGAAEWTVSVNGEAIAGWPGGVGSGSAGAINTCAIGGVALAPVDTLSIEGRRADGEFARVDSIGVRKEPDPVPNVEAFDHFAFHGQSNAERHFYRIGGDGSPGPIGAEVFGNEILALRAVDVSRGVVAGAREPGHRDPAQQIAVLLEREDEEPVGPVIEAEFRHAVEAADQDVVGMAAQEVEEVERGDARPEAEDAAHVGSKVRVPRQEPGSDMARTACECRG